MHKLLNVVEFPKASAKTSIPEALRKLADAVENGEYDDAFNLAWVIDCGNSRVELGYNGSAGHPAADAHFLFGVAMTRITLGALSK